MNEFISMIATLCLSNSYGPITKEHKDYVEKCQIYFAECMHKEPGLHSSNKLLTCMKNRKPSH